MEMNETTYQSPTVEVIDIYAESIICASGTDVTVSDPWTGNVEQDW